MINNALELLQRRREQVWPDAQANFIECPNCKIKIDLSSHLLASAVLTQHDLLQNIESKVTKVVANVSNQDENEEMLAKMNKQLV
jgi:hypothetical protein